MVEVDKPLGRSKGFALRTLNKHLGKVKTPHLTRASVVIEFGRKRAKEGAGSATLAAEHLLHSYRADPCGCRPRSKISTEQVGPICQWRPMR